MADRSELTFGTIVIVKDENDCEAIVVGLSSTKVTVISEMRYAYPGNDGSFTGSTWETSFDNVEVA